MDIKIEDLHPESQLAEIRRQREPLLAEADIMIHKALDTGQGAVPYRQYRQALRDITDTYAGRLDELEWPAKPA